MQINTTSDALDNLNKKLGGADIEIEPSTNKVDALKKIYKTLGGTDDVAGLSTVYQVLEKITEVAGGGGGNPNSVQVIEGTLVNPIGDVDFNELVSALYVGADQTGEAHATIAADATVLGFGLLQQPVYGFNGTLRSTAGAINEDGSLCNEIYWYLDGEQLALHAYIEQDGVVTDIAAYASQIPTTLTIYWHPMPEAEGE